MNAMSSLADARFTPVLLLIASNVFMTFAS